MTNLYAAMQQYVAVRRALGFKLRQHEGLLRDFAQFMEDRRQTTITIDLAVAWATAPILDHPYTWKRRLSVIRNFARYFQTLDPATEVPPSDHLAYRYQRPVPFLYTDDEIRALIGAAADLFPSFRAVTYQTLIGLLAATGMRLGEALRLNLSDVSGSAHELTIRFTKFGKSRIVPVHPTVADALEVYRRHRNTYAHRRPPTESFFLSLRGTRLHDGVVHKTFRVLVREVGLAPRAGSGVARIHGLRHTFTVATIRDWYATGQPVASQLPLLSAYLGHVNPVSTYWYLQTTPELLRLALEHGPQVLKGPR